jgi:hypothetical protein
MERTGRRFHNFEEFERDVLRKEEMEGSVFDLYDEMYLEELDFDSPAKRGKDKDEDDDDDDG